MGEPLHPMYRQIHGLAEDATTDDVVNVYDLPGNVTPAQGVTTSEDVTVGTTGEGPGVAEANGPDDGTAPEDPTAAEATSPAADAPEATSEALPAGPARPRKDATKAAWAEYATSLGHDVPEAFTKSDIQALFQD